MSLPLKTRCLRYIKRNPSVALSKVATRFGIKPATLRSWRFRAAKGVAKSVAVEEAKPTPPQWMRSLHHDWAHLVGPDGVALCSARIPLGSMWHPAEETRRCTRCKGAAKKLGFPELAKDSA